MANVSKKLSAALKRLADELTVAAAEARALGQRMDDLKDEPPIPYSDEPLLADDPPPSDGPTRDGGTRHAPGAHARPWYRRCCEGGAATRVRCGTCPRRPGEAE